MIQSFGKPLGAMLIAFSSGVLFQNIAIAESSSIQEQPTALPTPRFVELSNWQIEGTSVLEDALIPESTENTEPMAQVTSVSQLTDVQPTDWAFGALQSLVERYGCIEGYPDRTYRGNRAISRYEFAAGLNQCLNRIQELIAIQPNGTDTGISKEDLSVLEKLQAEFANELISLKGRLDSLDARAATIEKQQFSATSKLTGIAITYLGDAFGKNADPANNATFSYVTALFLNSSLTGKDTLTVGLEAFNIRRFNTATEFPEGRLSGITDETRVHPSPIPGNGSFGINKLQYSFPANDQVMIFLTAFLSDRRLSAPISQLNNGLIGPITRYGQINPLTEPIGLQTGVGVVWKATPWLTFDFAAGSEFGSASNPSRGLFNGGYGTSIRPVIDLGRLRLTGYYVHTYSPNNGIDSLAGSNAAKVVGAGPVVANSYVGAAFYRVLPNFDIGGSVAYSNARALGEGTKGDAQVWNYDINFTLYDLGKKGNMAGLILGAQPRLAGTSSEELARAIGLPPGQRSDRNVGYHIEAFYSHRLSDNITITPGLIWLTAPNHDERNPDVIMGIIRSSFFF